jgi:hypothetical protein
MHVLFTILLFAKGHDVNGTLKTSLLVAQKRINYNTVLQSQCAALLLLLLLLLLLQQAPHQPAMLKAQLHLCFGQPSFICSTLSMLQLRIAAIQQGGNHVHTKGVGHLNASHI